MNEALLDFYTSSGKRKPDQIIIFRDGESPDNVLHGTVIDNKVCHPKNNDFYLGIYTGMIGIRRQTHYHVLLDQAGFSADDLQKDASKTSSSHGGMYTPGVISVPQLSRLKDKVNNFILVC
ncbi:Protein argonaute 4 -like protein [Gossypium arboreum]|uniref:Protein argonaute 4-like protein n=1 Tax=Gossypium arboreum TaxID=29729 RepID=A0A0B0NCE6_GOSAR|nr:Protein argonaute 4 -like protein [Gossypium arboreum]